MTSLFIGCPWPTLGAVGLLPTVPRAICLPRVHPHQRRAGVSYAASKPTATAPSTTGKKELRGIMRPRPISPALQTLVGVPEISRTQALKQIWAYIKENNLQDPDNRKIIVCDDKLKNIFGGKERVGFLEISGLINPHFLK